MLPAGTPADSVSHMKLSFYTRITDSDQFGKRNLLIRLQIFYYSAEPGFALSSIAVITHAPSLFSQV